MFAGSTRLPVIDVAATIVQDPAGRVLLAERKPGQLSPGFWELPGGKIEVGETPAQAAARELDEEVGIRAGSLQPWASYAHSFPTKRVNLRFFRAETWAGTPYGREGQRVAWIDPAAPSVSPLLPSNERVLQALSLPRRVAIASGHTIPCQDQLLSAIGQAADRGIGLFILCPPPLSPDQRVALARRAQAIAGASRARVLLQGSALEAQRAGVAGAVADAAALYRLSARPALRLWGAICHGAGDLQHAATLGADFILLGPPFNAELAARSPMPVFACGGGPDAASAWHADGYGTAFDLEEDR